MFYDVYTEDNAGGLDFRMIAPLATIGHVFKLQTSALARIEREVPANGGCSLSFNGKRHCFGYDDVVVRDPADEQVAYFHDLEG